MHTGLMQGRGVVVFLRSLENDFQKRIRNDALVEGKRHGFAVTTVSAGNDAGRQAAQIAALLEGAPIPGLKANAKGAHPDEAPLDASQLGAILVAPVREEALEDLARVSIERKVAWGMLGREASFITRLREEGASVPLFAVLPEQRRIGRVMAEQSKALAPAGGTIIAITGPSRISSCRGRVEGLWGELGPDYALTLLEADWTTECARLVLDRWLKKIDRSALPCVIAAQNDEMALGARQALRDAASAHSAPELLKVPIIGCDGAPGFGQRLVKEGRLTATISLPVPSGVALEQLVAYRDTGAMPPVQFYLPVSSFPPESELAPPPMSVAAPAV